MYKLLTIKDNIEWRKYLSCIPRNKKDIYFTPEYYSLYEYNGDGDAQCFIFENEGEVAIYPFLKNSINTLGYQLDKEYYDIQGAYGYNGLITSTNDISFIEELWECFDNYCQENDIIAEFMRFHPLLQNQLLASPNMNTFCSRQTVGLDLSVDDIWMQQLSSKNRNMIRKAIKQGVSIVESNDYETFRLMYNNTMTDLNASEFYYFKQNYYDNYQNFFHDKSYLCLATYKGEIIAGSMFLKDDYYVHYHLSARNRQYSSLAANNLILWYAIQKAKDSNCHYFHFGGGTTSNDDDSLLKFKKEFSKSTHDFWIGKRIHNQKIYEDVVNQWGELYPEKYESHKQLLLCYREI